MVSLGNQFTLLPAVLPPSLAPGAQTLATISFRPLSAGVKAGLVQVTTDDTDEPSLVFPLGGTGSTPPTRISDWALFE